MKINARKKFFSKLLPLLLLLLLTLISGASAEQLPAGNPLAIAQRIEILVNEARVKNGLLPIQHLDYLAKAAGGHSQEMLDLNYFAHESPTPGLTTPRERIVRAGGYDPITGENIYKCERMAPDQIADRTVKAWLASPVHYANLMKPEYNSVGVGVVIEGDRCAITQNFSKQMATLSQFTAQPEGGQMGYVLRGRMVEGNPEGAVFVQGQLYAQFKAEANGDFEIRGTAAAGSVITVSQKKSDTKFATALSVPVDAGVAGAKVAIAPRD